MLISGEIFVRNYRVVCSIIKCSKISTKKEGGSKAKYVFVT